MRILQSRKPAVSLFALIVVAGFATESDGGVIPWLYDAIFGPVRGGSYGSYYRPYYGPSYAPATPSPSPYGPGGYGGVPMGYLPRGGCSPCSARPYSTQVAFFAPACSIANTGCASGPCSLVSTKSDSGKEPTPAQPSQKTFVDEEPKAETQKYENSGFLERGTGAGAASSTDDVSAPKEEFLEPETTIRKRVAAPATTLEEDATPAAGAADSTKNSAGEANNDAPAPQAGAQPADKPDGTQPDGSQSDDESGGKSEKTDETDSSAIQSGPRFNFDQKVTWRVNPQRTRLTFRANFVNPTVVRRRLDVNADWMAVPNDTRIAKK